jgi:hypothetical protein
MGLDMYLNGRKYLFGNWKNPESNLMEDGYRVKEKILEIGYWRKHPNLHGYIVKNFAENGVDDCSPIELRREDLQKIIQAVKDKSLPDTEGFFFGQSDGTETEEDLKILTDAITWVNSGTQDESRSIVYRASW